MATRSARHRAAISFADASRSCDAVGVATAKETATPVHNEVFTKASLATYPPGPLLRAFKE